MKKYDSLSEINEEFVLTIGNFDGVHRGHQRVLSEIKKYCANNDLKLCVMTFVPHPVQILSPRKNYLINTYKERCELLENIKVDFLVEVDFNRDISTMSPSDFMDKFILSSKKIKKFYVGHDFAFGANKSGDYKFIDTYSKSHGLEIELLPRFDVEKCNVSSSRVRESILEGNVEYANELLGRDFFLSGRVVKGAGRGKTIGIPTANLQFDDVRITPKVGVYISTVNIGKQTWNSITNIGINPTFDQGEAINIETHIFDFDNDIYGDVLKVNFKKRIRDEKKFNSVNELISQIRSDIAEAKEYLES
ncbi:bifunctional riboflavin kinase/FAD synthetase [Bacteriovorax sp. Seq25_V]|uniref:bifunctional riboflavin kinase/FAD synthetase n=1 Tax=Bacteriovorax sp. Seq25_V TaxID=1201288 RepID=UPI00038A16CD|nr:bifunctional riboflavin kinase/FAD synthetase [Bacteriovorax sp. Seq25_V]EQC43562.1 riboflavin biosynthesis protein RibF [Bacteriovorax sp. Seq25_V]